MNYIIHLRSEFDVKVNLSFTTSLNSALEKERQRREEKEEKEGEIVGVTGYEKQAAVAEMI